MHGLKNGREGVILETFASRRNYLLWCCAEGVAFENVFHFFFRIRCFRYSLFVGSTFVEQNLRDELGKGGERGGGEGTLVLVGEKQLFEVTVQAYGASTARPKER